MIIQDQSLQPIFVQSSKLIEWLINRKLIQKDYPKWLTDIHSKLKALSSTAVQAVHTLPGSWSYFTTKQIFQQIELTDTSTDIFGRASQNVRAWRDVVSSYEKNNLYIAEISESVHEIASEQVPKCRGVIADRGRLITELRQKVKEQSSGVTQKEDVLQKAYKDFNLEKSDNAISLRLLEEASSALFFLHNFVTNLRPLDTAVELYRSFAAYARTKSGDCTRSNSNFAEHDGLILPTLKLLIDSGHVRFFTWITKQEPVEIGKDDDFIPALLVEEKAKLNASTLSSVDPSENAEFTDTIEWGDVDTAEFDFDIVDPLVGISGGAGSTDYLINVDTTLKQDSIEPLNIASGKSARFLLDTVEGRTALLADLKELGAFLNRFIENHIEINGYDEGDTQFIDSNLRTKGPTGSVTVQNIILQNAPSIVRSVSLKDASSMLSHVESACAALTENPLCQLLMIRSRPGYLDRLVGHLTGLKTQVSRAKARVADAQNKIHQAIAEQEAQALALVQHKTACKELTVFLEKELTRICNRPIQIIGQVLDL